MSHDKMAQAMAEITPKTQIHDKKMYVLYKVDQIPNLRSPNFQNILDKTSGNWIHEGRQKYHHYKFKIFIHLEEVYQKTVDTFLERVHNIKTLALQEWLGGMVQTTRARFPQSERSLILQSAAISHILWDKPTLINTATESIIFQNICYDTTDNRAGRKDADTKQPMSENKACLQKVTLKPKSERKRTFAVKD